MVDRDSTRQALRDTAGELRDEVAHIEAILAGEPPLPALLLAQVLVELDHTRAEVRRLVGRLSG